jgi:hypothetical protein
MASTWQYTSPPPHRRRPEVVLIAFARGPLTGQVELSLATFGAPSEEAVAHCSLRTIDRRVDPAWFDAWRQGSLRDIATKDLGGQLAELDAADHAHVIVAAPQAPTDLGYLQGAWALARYLVARGATLILDAHAMTYRPASAIAQADAPLDVAREVRVVFETSSTRPDGAHALHTRGMRKFGAPELLALCSDVDAPLVGSAISELADAVARGTELATPRHAVHVAPGVTWVAIEDEHRIGELLQLGNEARVLVDDRGHHLIGVLGRLPVPS